MSNFSTALSYVLTNEGSAYTNDPNDPGSSTRFGITLKTLQAWRNQLAGAKTIVSAADVATLTVAEAGQIYKAWYWDKLQADLIADEGIATAVFDTAVNCGVPWAAKGAQQIADTLTSQTLAVDGFIGPKSLVAINQCQRRSFLRAFTTRQEEYYLDLVQSRPSLRSFRRTWLRRASLYLDLNA